MAESGVDEQTGRWVPAFAGQRPPFARGHELSTQHGSYAVLKLAPRAAELADTLRELTPACSDSDEPAIQTLGMILAQLERATNALDGATGSYDELARLRADCRGWANTARRFMNDLALTPSARARLGLDVARAEAARLTISRLVELADAEQAGDER